MKVRVIGDVHGKVEEYKKLIADVDYSIQLGDMGFKKAYDLLAGVDPLRHVFIPGNHDDYDNLPTNALGNFGKRHLGDSDSTFTFFIARGALSVDKQYRQVGVSYWESEELSYNQAMTCLRLYDRIRPDYVFSHDCPEMVLPLILTNDWKMQPSFTNKVLQQMVEIHRPKHWFFGHHHNTKDISLRGIDFHCLGELEYTDIEV